MTDGKPSEGGSTRTRDDDASPRRRHATFQMLTPQHGWQRRSDLNGNELAGDEAATGARPRPRPTSERSASGHLHNLNLFGPLWTVTILDAALASEAAGAERPLGVPLRGRWKRRTGQKAEISLEGAFVSSLPGTSASPGRAEERRFYVKSVLFLQMITFYCHVSLGSNPSSLWAKSLVDKSPVYCNTSKNQSIGTTL